MPKLNIYKSKGRTVYLCGLSVYRHKDGRIVLTADRGDIKHKKNDIAYCERGSDIEKFFEKMLGNSI